MNGAQEVCKGQVWRREGRFGALYVRGVSSSDAGVDVSWFPVEIKNGAACLLDGASPTVSTAINEAALAEEWGINGLRLSGEKLDPSQISRLSEAAVSRGEPPPPPQPVDADGDAWAVVGGVAVAMGAVWLAKSAGSVTMLAVAGGVIALVLVVWAWRVVGALLLLAAAGLVVSAVLVWSWRIVGPLLPF